MPRKIVTAKKKHENDTIKKVHNILGEGSDDSEPFQSAITNSEDTDYALEFTSYFKTKKTSNQDSLPKATQQSISNLSCESIPAQRLETSKRGSAKRKTKTPKKHPQLLLQEIRKLQDSTNLLIPRQPFMRLIREIFFSFSAIKLRITPVAIEALQTAAEVYLTYFFQDCYACTLHRDRKTLIVKDMHLVRFIRGQSDPGNS